MAGPRSVLTLLAALGLRPLGRHYGRTLLTLLGVAAGVGVYVGIDLAVQASIQSFTRTARAVAGPAQLRVHRLPLAMPESVLVTLRPLEGRALFRPTLQAAARAGGPTGYPFTILGVDLIGDPRFVEAEREGKSERTRSSGLVATEDPRANVRALFDVRSLWVPVTLSHAIGARDSVTVVVGTRSHRFQFHPIRVSGPITSAAATVAFMDVAPFQERFGRVGQIDWVDVEPAPGVAADTLRDQITRLLTAAGSYSDVRVEPPEERALQVEHMLASYRRNLRALSLISLVVGMLLAYNALLSSVLQRRSEIALLRALGATRGLVALLLGAEGIIVGLLGGALGVLLGRALAVGALRLVSRTVSDLYARTVPGAVELTGAHWQIGIALGLASAAIASFGPLREGLRVRPLEFLREEHPQASERSWSYRRIAFVLGALALAIYLIVRPDGPGEGLRGYIGAAAALLAGGLLALPAFVLTVRLLRTPLARLWPPAGRLAYATALAARRRLGVSVAALLLAFSIVWGMASLVESFRVTVEGWADSTLRADLWITPRSRAGSPAEGTMPASWTGTLAALPEVADVDAFRLRELSLGGELIWLGAGTSDVLARHGYLPLVGGGNPRPLLARMKSERIALVSEPYARRHDVRLGTRLLIPSPTGSHLYRVAAVYRDYSSDRGYVIIDRSLYLEDFRDSLVTTYALYLKPGVSRERGARAAEAALGRDEVIRVTDTRTIREEVRRVMRNTFAVTDALEAVAAVVALLSVLGALAALVLERTREIGVLRAIGADQRQIVRSLLVEGGLVAVTGLVLGGLTGLLLSAVLVHVLNRESFGWTLELTTPWGRVLLVAAVLFTAALLATLPPARRAARIPPREAMNRV